MAYIRERNGKYFAEIRQKGYPNQNKTFKTKLAAVAWARRIESSMDQGSWVDTRETQSVLIDHIMDDLVYSFERFGLEVAGPKLGQLNQIKEYFQGVSIHDLTFDEVLDFAAYRLQTVAASTLQTQMYYFKQAVTNSRIKTEQLVVDMAIEELKLKKLIRGSTKRDRRLQGDEWERLLDEAGAHWIRPIMEIAVESGMRQGEIHSLEWQHIDFDKNLIGIWRKNKNEPGGKKWHVIPFWQGVREVLLREHNQTGNTTTVFGVKHAASISDKFAKMTKKLGIVDLRFHDLRHEAISRMFEVRKMRVEEVRLVSGHASLEQLSRYVNLRPENLVD